MAVVDLLAHTDGMDVDGTATSQSVAGLPQTGHSALTPLGQIEQATKFAAGFKQPRRGWRKPVAVVGFVIIAAAALAVIVAGMLSAAGK